MSTTNMTKDERSTPTEEVITACLEVIARRGKWAPEPVKSLFAYLGTYRRQGKDIDETLRRLQAVPGVTPADCETIRNLMNSLNPVPAGMFTGYARSIGKCHAGAYTSIIQACIEDNADEAISKLLIKHTGKIKGLGISTFSEACMMIRRDLYPVINDPVWRPEWLKYISDDDYSQFVDFAQRLRRFCDRKGWPVETRFNYFDDYLHEARGENVRIAELDDTDIQTVVAQSDDVPASFEATQGRSSDSAKNKAVETYAISRARTYFEREGHHVEERGKPIDLICQRDGEEIKVEVKGLQAKPSDQGNVEVVLTRNEYRLASDGETDALFIVHSIIVDTVPDGTWRASGGEMHVIQPWLLNPKDCQPTEYRYTVRLDKSAARHDDE